MANFGLSDLRLVSPRTAGPTSRADAWRSGAADVLGDARVLSPIRRTALGDLQSCLCDHGARARRHQGSDHAGGSGAAVACGGGARREDAASCSATSAPGSTMRRFRSPMRWSRFRHRSSRRSISGRRCCSSAMNGFALATTRRPRASSMGRCTQADARGDVPAVRASGDASCSTSGFLFPPDKQPPMIRAIRAMLHRAHLTYQEMQTIRGMIVALSRGKHRVTKK